MPPGRYEAFEDPYRYPDSHVLRNKLNLRDAAALEAFEAEITAQRSTEPLPPGKLDAAHYKAVHRHLFQDVYEWAGKPRTVRISKGDSPFCYPEYIEGELKRLFAELKRRNHLRGLSAEEFAVGAAWFLSELNAIHVFREGNGRTQMSFLTLLATEAGHPLDADRLDPQDVIPTMIAAFDGNERPLADLILRMI